MRTLKDLVESNTCSPQAEAMLAVILERDKERVEIAQTILRRLMADLGESPEAIRGACLALDVLTSAALAVIEDLGFLRATGPLSEISKAAVPLTLAIMVRDPRVQSAVEMESRQ